MKDDQFSRLKEIEKNLDKLEQKFNVEFKTGNEKAALEIQSKINATHKSWQKALLNWLKSFNNDPNVT